MFSGVILLVLCVCSPLMVVEAGVIYRQLTVINQCQETVRVGRTGDQCLPRDDTKYGITGCPPQMSLNPANNQCFWDIPNFGNGTDLQPGTKVTLQVPSIQFMCTSGEFEMSGVQTTWSGNLWGATGCMPGKPCETGLCFFGPNDSRNGYCTSYQGPTGPLTKAEFTFQNTGDFYDISAQDGVNIPIEMRPNSPTPANMFGRSGVSADYWCGNPGGISTPNSNLNNCSWYYDLRSVYNYGDQSVNLTLVAKNTTNMNCMRDSDCPDGEYCGVLQELNEFGGPGSQLFPGKCGQLIGIWTSEAICSWASGFTTSTEFPNTEPFRCMTATGQGPGKFGDLYRCASPYSVSGYTNTTESGQECNSLEICGCPEWIANRINAPSVSPCFCNNTEWLRSAFPWLQPMKKACPTSYTYSFDDQSSTFQCSNNPTSNTMGYTITFCPEGTEISRPRQLPADNGGAVLKYSFSVHGVHDCTLPITELYSLVTRTSCYQYIDCGK